MSDFGPAVAMTLAHEGGYAFVPKTGECVNMGLTHWFLRSVGFLAPLRRSVPVTDQEKALVRSLSVNEAFHIYLEYFWKPYRCGEISDQAIASKYFDLCVNTGPQEACRILQRAANSAGPAAMAVDGRIGPMTLARVNSCDPAALMAAIRTEGTKVYQEIAAAQPNEADRLPGWLSRLDS